MKLRPVLRYHGGKFKLADWVIDHLPSHRIYVEPFGGAASVLMAKPRSYAEVYNDLDDEIVNVFRVLRDPKQARELERKLRLTPFARKEFLAAYRRTQKPIEQARRTVIKSFMGFGSSGIFGNSNRGMRTRASVWFSPTGFRNNSNRSGTTPAHDWKRYPDHLAMFCDRLRGVVIERSDAIQVMQTHDRIDTLHYVDPPYPKTTRAARHEYRYEMTDDQHRALAAALNKLRGMVVVSSYPSPLYDQELFATWTRIECKHFADGAHERVEVLYFNAAATKNLPNPRLVGEEHFTHGNAN